MGNYLLRSASNETTPDIKYLSGTTNGSVSKSQFSWAVAMSDGYEESHPEGQISEAPNLKVFTSADLKSATNNFKVDALLGEEVFGWVFKGWIDERTLHSSKSGLGMIVAIIKFNPESTQGFKEWQSEMNFLGSLSHPNIVKLLGYCWEEEKEPFLVYEFMQKGSLEKNLFRRNPDVEPLSWELRLKIAIEAARGLAFLHTLEKQVIYRDFKALNILLDTKYNAKLSNFRLGRLGTSAGDSHVTTSEMVTYGYAAPEYRDTGHVSVKSDVYSFGVVLLEMMTGLRAFDRNRPTGQHHLVDWSKPVLSHKRKLRNIMDKTMEGQYSSDAMLQTAQLASKCLEMNPKNRPSMKEVLEVLKQIYDIKEIPKGSIRPASDFSNSSSQFIGVTFSTEACP